MNNLHKRYKLTVSNKYQNTFLEDRSKAPLNDNVLHNNSQEPET